LADDPSLTLSWLVKDRAFIPGARGAVPCALLNTQWVWGVQALILCDKAVRHCSRVGLATEGKQMLRAFC